MDIHPLQQPDDEEDRFDAAFQEAFYSNYCQGGRSSVDVVNGAEWQEFAVSASAISPEKMIREGFSLSSSSPKLKAKRRKSAAEKIAVHRSAAAGGGDGRRDRHSKVCTARGTRDRRVRLSPKTAIQFYDVQDRLGYDRPSKAIDWLMKEAKAAIDALQESPPFQATVAAAGKNDATSSDHQSSFGFLTNVTAPLLSSYAAEDSALGQDAFLSPEYFDPNLEMIRLQRIFHFPGSPVSGGRGGQICSEREPLQSSIPDNSPIINPPFSGFRLPNQEIDIPNFAAATATLTEDENVDKIPSSSKPSSLLHYLV
ncbi:uncharacterized protein LOC127247252 [Andrographis paniculata]|uniref:uncharacterized protein LOC127247252 n=1 Tax=Andrographis paniculata TaxID=175694 RepID=UPI0021E915C3|nr:uncharacterized protein LOC127247252 [Andrographis paniculata]